MKNPHRFRLLPALLLLILPSLASAQGIYIDHRPRPIDRPVPQDQCLELVRHAVRATVHGNLAEFEILQRFRNQSDRTIEGTYLFPIPRNAVATGLTLSIGGKQVEGEVLEAGKAKGIYVEIVRRLRDPALLEYVNDGLLRASIFPIEARSLVEIGIRFAAPVERVGDLFSLRLPLKFAAQWNAEVTVDVRLESELPLSTIYSPSHDVDLVRDGDRKARMTYEGRNSDDFLLYFARSESDVGLSLLTHRLPAKDGTFALLISPKLDAAPGQRQPRDVIFVLDRSGSMAGDKWTQAVGALSFGLRSLEPEDRFALVSFATDVRCYKQGLVRASREEVRGAIAHLEDLRPAGGTNIGDSLQTALAMLDPDPARLEVIPFLTDGLPTIGQVEPDRILKQVREANGRGARLFCFGVGYDVNPLLLDRLAADNGGAADYVTEGENLELRVSAFFDRTRHPVLTNPELTFHGVEVFDIDPVKLPD
ncbi:MAG: VIT domain-containing protein, partial [Planctomycetota bacterium]